LDDELDEDIAFMIVEDMPAFGHCTSKSGDERHECTQREIIRFVSTNTKYPPIAKDAGIQGTVFVYFVVGRDGVVKDVRVLRPVDSRLDAEAVRVVESLPRFVPGRQQGKSVSVQYTIPVKFIIR
jgi:protein TonB